MDDLFRLPAARVETRWASPENPRGARGAGGQADGGRKGRPCVPVAAGQTLVLAEESDVSGTVRRIWLTIDDRSPAMLRGLRLDFFWDGAATPAVSAPLGDFFSQPCGRTVAFESDLFSNPEGRSFCTVVPMPFRTGMRLTLTNESGVDLAMCFYDVDYTVGDAHGPDTLYFHAAFRRENPTVLRRDFAILPPVEGRGRFLGCALGVRADRARYGRTWWGEGEVKAYVDGDDALPTLCGTGTEDYIGTAWGQGAYAHRYQGCPLADLDTGTFGFYRLHVPDPVWFHASLRVDIQQIGWGDAENRAVMRHRGTTPLRTGVEPVPWEPDDAAGGIFEREDDWSATAWFYLDRPENGLPPLAPAAERIAGC